MGIPRIIHQTAARFDALPDDVRANVERVRQLNPGWEYRFYDDEALWRYLEANLQPDKFALCRQVNPKYPVVLADVFRYLAAYCEGGVYLDIKSGMKRPLDAMLAQDDKYLISQWRNRLGEPYLNFGFHRELEKVPGGELQQWHVIAEPRHPFALHVLNRVFARMRDYDPARDGAGRLGVLRLSGPIAYTLAIAPLLRKGRFRLVDSHGLGLVYSIYPWREHVDRSPGHYSLLDEPIMLPAKS